MSDPVVPAPALRTVAQPGASMDRRVVRTRALRWRNLRWPAAGALTVAAIVAAFLLVPRSGTLSVSAADITSGIAAQAPFQEYLPVRATVAPLHTVFVGAVEGGQVATVLVQDGASVTAGQVLATLSNPQLELDVTSRAAAITAQLGSNSAEQLTLQQSLATEADAIAETSYNLLKAQRDLGIRTQLHTQGFESDAGVKSFADEQHYYAQRLGMLRQAYARDTATAASQSTDIAQAETRLKTNLDVVQNSLQALTLRAPLAGRLTNFSLEPGQSLKQGDQVGQIDSEGAYRLDADIDEFYLGRVNAGQAASANFDGVDVPMTVARVKPQVANGQFRAELIFGSALPAGLRRGQSADTRIILGAAHPALVIPFGPWLDASGGNFVYVLDAAGRHAIRRPITIGRRNPEQVEVTAGLSPGDRVVTSSYARFQNFSQLLVQ